jgi:hypothetical protein
MASPDGQDEAADEAPAHVLPFFQAFFQMSA